MKAAFDHAHRLTPTVDFDYGGPDSEKAGQDENDRVQNEIHVIWEFFKQREQWILAGRTPRSRNIRRAIVLAQTQGETSLSAIARQFGIKRQSVHRQVLELRKLTHFS